MTELNQAAASDVALHLLVLRCQTGDERAFRLLMERFGVKTLAYLRGVVGEDADDVQQDVWLAVYKSVRSLANPSAFRTWLFRTTRHRAMDYLRRRKREAELLDDSPIENVGGSDPSDDETVDVRNYRATHGDFPHESTADQWFNESQFETYRMLGRHSVEQWCASRATDQPERATAA